MWLAQTPTALVLSSYARIPALEAEQSILAANRIGMGSGTMKPESATALARRWSLLASGEEDRPDPYHLAQKGFAVRKIPVVRNKVVLTDGD